MASVSEALVEITARAHLSASTLREEKQAALAKLQSQQPIQGAGHTPSGERSRRWPGRAAMHSNAGDVSSSRAGGQRSPFAAFLPCTTMLSTTMPAAGPRRKAEGVGPEDEQQGILAAEPTATGGALLRITLLAAGYLIGPAGASVRDVSRVSGAEVRSWSESWREGAGAARRVRTVIVEVSAALDACTEAQAGHLWLGRPAKGCCHRWFAPPSWISASHMPHCLLRTLSYAGQPPRGGACTQHHCCRCREVSASHCH